MKVFLIILSASSLLNNLAFAAESNCFISNYDQVESVLKDCTSIVIGDLKVPAGKTLNLQPLDNTTILVTGVVSFEYQVWEGPLISINATGLQMVGLNGSLFYGNGPLYWDGLGEWGTLKPNFAYVQAFNSKFDNLQFKNSPRYFILISNSKNVTFSNFKLDNLDADPSIAGQNHSGHNTDGFDVFNVTDITIENSTVFNQDDCIALRHGKNIHVNRLYCHGGHGLSLSVGFSNISIEDNTISDVVIENSALHFGENAIHIKTHVDACNGSVTNITYRNIWFQGQTDYGIKIEQNYKNLPAGSHPQVNATDNIPINGLTLENVSGSVTGAKAIGVYINCAKDACLHWKWQGVSVRNSKNNCNFEPSGFTC